MKCPLLEELLWGGLRSLCNQNLNHLLTKLFGLGSFSIASSLDLVFVVSSEGNSEPAHEVAVASLGLDESLNEEVPLLYETTEPITGDVSAVEVGVVIEALDFSIWTALRGTALFSAVRRDSQRRSKRKNIGEKQL